MIRHHKKQAKNPRFWKENPQGELVWVGPVSYSLRDVREYMKAHPVEHKALPDIDRMLWAQNDFFTAAAIYHRKGGFWTCRDTAPCLAFLRGRSPEDGKLELLKRGYRWQWDNTFEQGHRNTTAVQSPLGGVIEPEQNTVEAAQGTEGRNPQEESHAAQPTKGQRPGPISCCPV